MPTRLLRQALLPRPIITEKLSITELDMDNLVDYRLYSKNDFPSGFSDESWMIEVDDFFITDGALYVAYGYKKQHPRFNLFIISATILSDFSLIPTGRERKTGLRKQYVKKYQFSVSSDPNAADKVATYGEDGYTIRDVL